MLRDEGVILLDSGFLRVGQRQLTLARPTRPGKRGMSRGGIRGRGKLADGMEDGWVVVRKGVGQGGCGSVVSNVGMGPQQLPLARPIPGARGMSREGIRRREGWLMAGRKLDGGQGEAMWWSAS